MGHGAFPGLTRLEFFTVLVDFEPAISLASELRHVSNNSRTYRKPNTQAIVETLVDSLRFRLL